MDSADMAGLVVVDSTFDSYCPDDEATKRMDLRTVGRLLSDDPNGTPIPPNQIPSNEFFQSQKLYASGLLEAACLRGERYRVADLNELVDPKRDDQGVIIEPRTYNAAANLIFNLHVDMMMVAFMERRQRTDVPEYTIRYTRAMAFLDQLENGRRLFGTVQHEQAGRIGHREMTAEELACREIQITVARRWYGERSNKIANCGDCSDGSPQYEGE